MRQNSLLNAFLVVINLAVVTIAVYLAIDALDLNRRQNARLEQSLNRLSEAIKGLEAAPPAQAAAFSPRSASPQPEGNLASATFLNDDLRDTNATDGDSIVGRTTSLPGNLNYLINNEATVSAIWGLLVDSLAGRNNNDLTRYEPLMAESWDVTPDGLIYTIRLRDNIYWHPYVDPVTKMEMPSRRVTARDFLFYWETVQNQKVPADPLRTYYEDLAGIEIVDDVTFRVIWKRPYSLAEAITLGLKPLPAHYYRPDPEWDDDRFAEEFVSSPRNQWIVGTGPYRLVHWDRNTEIAMERDESYYGPKPPIKARRIKVIPDTSTSFLEFKKGGLDSYGLQPSQWYEETPEPDFALVTPKIETAYEDSLAWDAKKKAGELPDDYRFEKFQYNSTSWAYLGYNMRRPLFREREVRAALTHLVDRERILDEVYMGLGTIISGPFIPQSPYYNHDVKPLPFDPETATRMLAAAGWEDTDGDGILDKDYDGSGTRKPFRFTLIISAESPIGRKTAAIIERDMLKARIKMDIKPIEWSVYTQLLNEREFDACFLMWSGGVEGDPYQIWHGSGADRKGSSNHVGFASEEADMLIEKGRRTIDRLKRYEIYRRLHEVIAYEQPYTFLFAPTATLAQSKRYRNALVYKGGAMDPLLQWVPQSLQVVR